MRRGLALAAVAVLAGMFGAGDALAALVQFNPQTGQFTYTANDAADPTHVNGVSVFKSPSVDGYVEIKDSSGAPVFTDQGVADHCYLEEPGAWACPAGSVLVNTVDGNDTITVSASLTLPTRLQGGKGTDVIQGGGGPDEIYGGCKFGDCPGSDTMYGGAGPDAIHGYTGADGMTGQGGDDVLEGGGAGDLIYGGSGKDTADYSVQGDQVVVRLDDAYNDGSAGENDNVRSDIEVVRGGAGDDILYGNDSANTLRGGPGDDYLDAAGGNDWLYGESGVDLLRGGFGADYLSGGNMINGCCEPDTASWAGRTNPVTASIDFQSNDGESGENDYVASDVENLTGGNGSDTLTGNGQGNKLSGGIGNDSLDGKGGGEPPGSPGLFVSDSLQGGSGNDTINGGPAGSFSDQVDGGIGTDLLSYQARTDHLEIWLDGSNEGEDEITGVENVKDGSASDVIVGNDDGNVLYGYGGNDTMLGKGGVDILYGMDANDSLYGGSGHDLLSGLDGADTLDGEADDDYLAGGAGFDTATYAASASPVTVTLDGGYNDGVAGEGDNVLPDVEAVVGGSAGDTITGSSGPNSLTGGGGGDTLNGDGAADTLDGGPGADKLNGGADGDTLLGGVENDELHGDGGYDSLSGGPGPDLLDGGSEGDTANYLGSSAAVNLDLAAGTATGEGADTLTSVESAFGSAFGDTLLGTGGPNTLSGAGGPDTIRGREDGDSLNGGDGDDVFRGGSGNDIVSGGPGTDRMDFSNAPNAVTVDLSTLSGPATGEGSDSLLGIENVDGSASFGDKITGSAGANVLKGLGGSDQLYGLGGDDTLDGGNGTDTLDGGANTDSCLNGETLLSCE
jgi:Ca2+-binding RTX toxin-like protein